MVWLGSFFFFVCLGANCVHVLICMTLLVSIMLGINFVGLMLIEMTTHWQETLWVKTSICNHMKSISSCGTKILEYHISCASINPLNFFPILTHCINSSSKNANKLIDGVHQVVGNLYIAFKIHPNVFQFVLLILITLQWENHLFLKPCNMTTNAKIIPQMIPLASPP
jgi:hypothetical protein